MPSALRAAFLREHQQTDEPAYRFARQGAAAEFAAANPRSGFSAQLSAAGLTLRASGGDSGRPAGAISLASFGCLESPTRAAAVAPRLQGPRLEYVRGALTEWYVNSPAGLEHGFEVPRDLGCRGDLIFELDVSSWPGAQLLGDGGSEARLVVQADGRQYVYGGLSAYDSDGKDLPARMELSGGRLRLRVAAAGARYPVTVDPTWGQQQKLLAADKGFLERFGFSVALSADGNTALIGAPGDTDPATPSVTRSGAAYVFTRAGNGWSQQQKLSATIKEMDGSFGVSVALSADGNTALIGAIGEDDTSGMSPIFCGVAYVFTRAGNAWSQQQRFFGADRATGDSFGISAALSADGNTALIGAFSESDATVPATTQNGAAYVFTRAGTAWSQQQKLLAADKANNERFGVSVALSADGNTALIGAEFDDDVTGTPTTDNGAAYVFSRVGTAWSQQQKLLAADKATDDNFGRRVTLSADGNTALIGSYLESDATAPATTRNGAAYAFTRAGTVWSQQQKLLVADKMSNMVFGYSVALTVDGNTALIGAAQESDSTAPATFQNGAAYVFTRAGNAWSQQQKFRAADRMPNAVFGFSVALSADGNTALIGASNDSDASPPATNGNGSAYVFEILVPNGTACTTGAACLSGICADGVCCDTACGGSDLADCQACSVAAGAPADGTCALLPTSQICRAATDVCDEAELCTGQSAACPQDAFKPSTQICREAVDPFDPAELCTGQSVSCPADIDSAAVSRKSGGGFGCAIGPAPISPAGPAALLAALLMLSLLHRRSRARSGRM